MSDVTVHDGCAAYCDSANDLPCRCCRLTARAEAAEAERDALRATVERVRQARDLMDASGFDEAFWYVAKIDDALDGTE